MAIAAQNASYTTQGPSGSGQIFSNSQLSNNEVQHVFNNTVTLDGTTTSFVLNYIDGTATLPYTPSAVVVGVTGGTQLATSVLAVATSTISATSVTVNLSAAGTNANTLKITGFIIR